MARKQMVQAREPIVINVGGTPVEYERRKVFNRKTDQWEEIDVHEHVINEADNGIPYAFKANEKVAKDHPAVKANPGAFAPVDDDD